MLGEEIVVSTLAGQVMGVITEETTEERWIRSRNGFLVQQKLFDGQWETVATAAPHCFFGDPKSVGI